MPTKVNMKMEREKSTVETMWSVKQLEKNNNGEK